MHFSLERSWYTGNQTITLIPSVPGASISYALGGALPNKPYQGPIAVGDNGKAVTLRARATIAGIPGKLQTHSYVFMPDRGGAVVVVNDSDLPVAPGETERPITFEFIPSPKTGLVPVADEAGTAPNMGGQSAGKSDKVYFRDEYGRGTLHGDVFGDLYYGAKPTLRHDHLFLRSDHTDETFLRNVMAHDALLAVGQFSPHGRFVDFFDNGVHKGTRYLVERPEGGFMESYTGVDKKQWLAVSGLDGFGTSLDGLFPTWADAERTLNVHSLVDFLLVQWQAGVRDFRPEEKNWRATGPIGLGSGPDTTLRWHFFNWDIDRGYMRDFHTFGSPLNVWEKINGFVEAQLIFQDRLYCAYFDGGPLMIPAMMARFQARLAQLQTTTLLTADGRDISAASLRLASEIEAWLATRERLLFDQVFPKDWVSSRSEVAVSIVDGMVSLSNPNGGSVYYRADGGDPRTPSGSLDPRAVPYEGPFPFPPGGCKVIARSYDPSPTTPLAQWSPSCHLPLVATPALD